jgi:hypothetical protein
MAWVKPRRSSPGQEGGVAGNSGGTGGSSLPGGGPAALGGGDTGLGRRREAGAPKHQCHRCHNAAGKVLGNGLTPPASPPPMAVGQICSKGRLAS